MELIWLKYAPLKGDIYSFWQNEFVHLKNLWRCETVVEKMSQEYNVFLI